MAELDHELGLLIHTICNVQKRLRRMNVDAMRTDADDLRRMHRTARKQLVNANNILLNILFTQATSPSP